MRLDRGDHELLVPRRSVSEVEHDHQGDVGIVAEERETGRADACAELLVDSVKNSIELGAFECLDRLGEQAAAQFPDRSSTGGLADERARSRRERIHADENKVEGPVDPTLKQRGPAQAFGAAPPQREGSWEPFQIPVASGLEPAGNPPYCTPVGKATRWASQWANSASGSNKAVSGFSPPNTL